MADAGPGSTSSSVAHFPPGTTAPTAAEREAARRESLRDPAHLERLNRGLAQGRALPKEEQQRIIAERKAEKAARAQLKAAKHAPPPTEAAPPPSGPPTVRSQRATPEPVAPPPDSDLDPRHLGAPKNLLDLCAA